MILGFPADDVAHQEPRDDAAIAEFCKENFGVSFPMFAKSNVVSDPLNPVFQRLNAGRRATDLEFNKYCSTASGRWSSTTRRARRPTIGAHGTGSTTC